MIMLILGICFVVLLVLWAFRGDKSRVNWEKNLNTKPPVPPRHYPPSYHDEPPGVAYKDPGCANFFPAHTKPPATAFHKVSTAAEIKDPTKPHPKPRKH